MNFKYRVLEIEGKDRKFIPIGVIVAPEGLAPFTAKFILNTKSITGLPECAILVDLVLADQIIDSDVSSPSLDKLAIPKAYIGFFRLTVRADVTILDQETLTGNEQAATYVFLREVVRHPFYVGVSISSTSSQLAALP